MVPAFHAWAAGRHQRGQEVTLQALGGKGHGSQVSGFQEPSPSEHREKAGKQPGPRVSPPWWAPGRQMAEEDCGPSPGCDCRVWAQEQGGPGERRSVGPRLPLQGLTNKGPPTTLCFATKPLLDACLAPHSFRCPSLHPAQRARLMRASPSPSLHPGTLWTSRTGVCWALCLPPCPFLLMGSRLVERSAPRASAAKAPGHQPLSTLPHPCHGPLSVAWEETEREAWWIHSGHQGSHGSAIKDTHERRLQSCRRKY